jgi:mediator of RNA polymerase II transcription subunit 14
MMPLSQLLKGRNSRFANDVLQLQYLGFDSDVGQVKLAAIGRMREPAKVRDILQAKDSNVSFSQEGNFAIIVDTKIGKSPTPRIIAHLSTLGTLCNLARTLRSHNFACKDISFSKVCFTYATDQEVTLNFRSSGRIQLQIPPQDPARRVAPLLEEIVNDPDVGFERFTTALSYFLPVLRAFTTLDTRHATHFPFAPTVLPRQVDFYRLVYPNPMLGPSKPLAAFDMHFKRNKDALEWRVSDVLPPAQREEREGIVPGVGQALGQFMRRVGTGWTGMRTLLVADKDGVEEAILELDSIVWAALDAARRQEPGQTQNGGATNNREIITID